MKVRFLFILTVVVSLIYGCVKEEFFSEGGSVVAVMEDIQTRTAVTDEGTFTWSSGDQVWLGITANPGYVTGTLSSGAGTGSANFSYGPHFGDKTGKAIYPFNTGHDINGDELSVVLPASYNLGTNLSNTNAAMYGVETNGSIKFNHLAGVMRFKFRNAPAGTDKFILTLDKKINGTFTADLTEDHPVLRTESTSSSSEKSITLNFDPLTSAQDIMLYVPLPLGTYTTLGLEVKAGSQSVWSYSNTVTNTINRKSLILMPTVTLAGSISGDIEGSENTIDLSASGTANSYIVSESGSYSFTPTKGNSSESVGTISSVDVLWESFGTSETPSVGSLISSVSYADGKISFSTPQSYREGNAVIAAKDANGTILWSWHIWLTDQPQEQIYPNNSGTVMDRNLGAISATAGDVGALGLYYQWGRKDPFLGSSSISESIKAESTITWPSPVMSDITFGTLEYATSNPTTYITYNSINYYNGDWYYTGTETTDDTRWQNEKTIYDPCPVGWRVPDGSTDGLWNTADFADTANDSSNKGTYFTLDDYSIAWYAFSGMYDCSEGCLEQVGDNGHYWSSTPNVSDACYLLINKTSAPSASFANFCYRSYGFPVRCLKEGSRGGDSDSSDPEPPSTLTNMANCYMITSPGTYGFPTVKGNSTESVGAVASAEVLWESFGTSEVPEIGSLISTVYYNNGTIYYKVVEPFREGNAVIAAKDASGNILWSWHIWLTDFLPQKQSYYNNAGIMMDRNLGAASASPGDVGSLGLLYQWGRKDPFLGSSSISESIKAESTITWPSSVEADASVGTVEYATSHPTTLITSSYDWYYTTSCDNTRWQSDKTIYDPCPSGWRVPDGGNSGVWAVSAGSSAYFNNTYDEENKGMNLYGRFGDDFTIWYPAAGHVDGSDDQLGNVGYGYYWSVTSLRDKAYYLLLSDYLDSVHPAYSSNKSSAFSVRCVYDASSSDAPVEPIPFASYSLQLSPDTYGWTKSSSVSNPDASLYDGVYESTNQGRDNTKSIMYIDIDGYDEFTIYVRSYAESTWDYVEVSNLDADLSNVKMTTSGNQKSGTSLSSYTAVTFTNIGGGQHRIMVSYKKDSSVNSNDDKGYLLIPKNQ